MHLHIAAGLPTPPYFVKVRENQNLEQRSVSFFFTSYVNLYTSHEQRGEMKSGLDLLLCLSILIILASAVTCNPIRISPGHNQHLELYEAPKVVSPRSSSSLPSFILTSKPLASKKKNYNEYFGSPKPDWSEEDPVKSGYDSYTYSVLDNEANTYLMDCYPDEKCEQIVNLEPKSFQDDQLPYSKSNTPASSDLFSKLNSIPDDDHKDILFPDTNERTQFKHDSSTQSLRRQNTNYYSSPIPESPDSYDPFAFHAKRAKKTKKSQRKRIRPSEESKQRKVSTVVWNDNPEPSRITDSRLSLQYPRKPKNEQRRYFPVTQQDYRVTSDETTRRYQENLQSRLPSPSRGVGFAQFVENPWQVERITSGDEIRTTPYDKRYGWDTWRSSNIQRVQSLSRTNTPQWVSIDLAKPVWVSKH